MQHSPLWSLPKPTSKERRACRFADFEQELWGLYNLEHSDQLGKSSGWPSLDEFYKVSAFSSYAVAVPLTCPSHGLCLLSGASCSVFSISVHTAWYLDVCYSAEVCHLQLLATSVFRMFGSVTLDVSFSNAAAVYQTSTLILGCLWLVCYTDPHVNISNIMKALYAASS